MFLTEPTLKREEPQLVRGEGLEPSRLRIRPSNVRVYQFHHPRASLFNQKAFRRSTVIRCLNLRKFNIKY